MNEILLIDKPMGMTSFDVVAQVRKARHEKKVGHLGTLDPNATGLLILLVGKYTKYNPYCVKDRKKYVATFSFGKKTDTQDQWGTILSEKEPKNHTLDELHEAAKQFVGKLTQIPPMYSAIKKDGKKLYEYARQGISVERKPRNIEVSVFDVEVIGDNLYQLTTVVSSGTYVRTLIEDYAASLGEYGMMVSLRRIEVDGISVADAITLEEMKQGKTSPIDPIQIFDSSYKIVEIEESLPIYQGKAISLEESAPQILLVSKGEILAIYEKRDDGLYHCVRGLF